MPVVHLLRYLRRGTVQTASHAHAKRGCSPQNRPTSCSIICVSAGDAWGTPALTQTQSIVCAFGKVLLDTMRPKRYIVNIGGDNMPSENKRINLTVPESLYEKIAAYKEANGFMSDAAACVQLVAKQLKAEEDNNEIISFMRNMPMEQLRKLSELGINEIRTMQNPGK